MLYEVITVTFWLLRLIYARKLNALAVEPSSIEAFDESRAIPNRGFLFRTLMVFSLVILAFITHNLHHVHLATVAIGGSFIMMMVTRQEPEVVLADVEWSTLFFFTGLFILVGGLEKIGLIGLVADRILMVTHGEVGPTSQLVLWISALATTVINSIPYTATMISLIKEMSASMQGNMEPVWWALSLGACLGGNGTLIGAAANIIVAGISVKTKYPLRFGQFVKVALPLMLVSIAIVSLYLYVRY